MRPDQVSNPGPLTYESDALPTTLCDPVISQENMNAFWSDSITMVAELNHFMFMQIDNPRWLPGAVTENSTNTYTKMTTSQKAQEEIDPSVFQNVSCIKPF